MSESATPEVEPESPPAKKGVFGRLVAIIASIGWLFIALGNYSDAQQLIRDTYRDFMASFTNKYEYEVLADIHVGNTIFFVEDLLGYPKVSKGVGDGVTANYFFDKKFLLTLLYEQNRVAAYTVLVLQDEFNPEISGLEDSLGRIGEFTYARYPVPPKKFLFDDSRTASYYLESIDTERSGRFVDLYLGSVAYGISGTGAEIRALYKESVFGEEEAEGPSLEKLREALRPSLFGRGEVPLEMIEKSLLTTAEFRDYFDSK